MTMPPRKKAGQGLGPRTIAGAMLDLRGGAAFLGLTEKMLRARVARRLIPFRRFGGRIVFVRRDLETFLAALEGCSAEEAVDNLKMRMVGE